MNAKKEKKVQSNPKKAKVKRIRKPTWLRKVELKRKGGFKEEKPKKKVPGKIDIYADAQKLKEKAEKEKKEKLKLEKEFENEKKEEKLQENKKEKVESKNEVKEESQSETETETDRKSVV